MTAKPKRSTLLTVLCILTFIGSAYGIINGAVTLASAGKIEKVKADMEKAREEMKEDIAKDADKDEGDKKAEQIAGKLLDEASSMMTKENLQKQAYIAIGTSILTLLGALLMFQLKAPGFAIYVVGKILEVGAPIALFGFGLATGIGLAFSGFIGVIFIVLYAFCLKEMKGNQQELDIQ